jgi:dTMP kinase
MDQSANTAPADRMVEPRLIAFEGGEGCGKSTVIDRLKDEPEFADWVFTREPGGTIIGERLRDMILNDKSLAPDKYTEILTFMTARAQLLAEVVRPGLAVGKIIVLDRYLPSTYAYQYYAELGDDQPKHLTDMAMALNMPIPGLVIWLDIDPVTGLARRNESTGLDRIEAKDLDYHQSVRAGYQRLFTQPGPWSQVAHQIDASQPKQVVYEQVIAALRQHLATKP